MEKFLYFTLRQKVFLNLLFVILILVGSMVLLKMPVERYPNIQFGKMYINTYLPGASPEDVELLVTREIEEVLEDVGGLDFIRATSYRERSNIVIKFKDESDYKKRFDDVRLKVLSAMDDLPDLPEPPVFNFLDVNDWFPTISVNVSGEHSNTTLSLIARELKIPLSQIEGVTEVKVTGEFDREFHLILSPRKLRIHGIAFLDAAKAIREANISSPAGHVDFEDGEFILKVDEQFRSRSDVFETIIRTDSEGSFLRVADIAEAGYFTYRDPFIIASVNGSECVTLQILKAEGGNSLKIAKDVRQIVAKAQPAYQDRGVKITVTQDSSKSIRDSVRVLGFNMMLGILLVCLTIWKFMGIQNAGITTIGIPFAFLTTMLIMYITDNSINEVSLFAFVLVSGIIVDDAIVVVENIYRYIQSGWEARKAIVHGTAEVFMPVVSATLTTIFAFLPMLLMTGMVGDFFSIIPTTIIFALIASLLECLFILPCHYLDHGAARSAATVQSAPENQFDLSSYLDFLNEGAVMTRLRQAVNVIVLWSMKFRYLSLLFLCVLFLIAVFMFITSFLGKSNLIRIQFFPDNYALYYVELTTPPGTPIHETHALVKKVAKEAMSLGPDMHESALGFAGFYINEDYSPQYGNNLGHVAITLPESKMRILSDYPENDLIHHLEFMRKKLAPLIPQDTQMVIRPEKDGPPSGSDVNIRILGISEESVFGLSEQIFSYLNRTKSIQPWLIDLQDDQGSDNRVLRIRIDKEKAAEFGLSVSQVAELASSVMEGKLLGKLETPDESIEVKMKLIFDQQNVISEMFNLPIIDHPAGPVSLGDVSKPVFSIEPGYLIRFQNQRAVTLTADIKPGAPVSSAMVVSEVLDFYEAIADTYPGATLSFAGEHESTRESFLSLSYAFIVAVLSIYLILAAQFHSYLQPLIILSSVMFALIGVIYGTFLSGTLFTINSFVAIVGVTGVVVNDSLVLVEFLNNCRRAGLERMDALVLAINIRLRPIFLTTLTTTLGLLPMALGIPEYSNVWGSMAMTFVTGLCTATFLTLIIVPVQWSILEQNTPASD